MMRSVLAGSLTLALVVLGAPALRPVPVTAAQAGENPRAFLQAYCITCHSQQLKSRGSVPVALDTLDASAVASDAKTWELVVRKMRAGVMPPAGMKRPDRAAQEQFVAWAEGALDRAARERPDPGRVDAFHRLNRTEYRNAVRDLLDLDVDVNGSLPPDDASYGFDNIAGVLKISPTLFERYLAVAQKVSRTALGIAPPSPTVDYVRVADDRAQEQELPGQLFGTRGGASIRYTFPMDASYTVRVQLSRDLNEQVPIYVEPQDLEISIDGERATVFTLPRAAAPAGPPPSEPAATGDADAPQPAGPGQGRGAGGRAGGAGRGGGRQGQEARNRADRDWAVRVPVKAGPHLVQVAFTKQSDAIAETARLPFLRPYPAGVNIAETRGGAYLRSVEIAGPFDPTGPGNSPSRQRILICTPGSAAGEAAPASAKAPARSRRSSPSIDASEDGCSTRILTTLARRAYRRPVTAADVQPLLAFYREGRAEGSFDQGIARALNRL